MTQYCNDYGDNPSCLGAPDERYTMLFDGEPLIFWCAFCGPIAHRMKKAIEQAWEERGPEFQDELEELIKSAETEQVRQ